MSVQISTAIFAIAFVVLYQVGMKIVPHSVSPVSALITFYVTALFSTLIASRFIPEGFTSWSASEFSWAAVLVGVAIVGIELGFLLMYRSGWSLATAPLVTMGAAAIILLPISLLVFKQPWSPRYLFGVAFCIYGLYLLAPIKK